MMNLGQLLTAVKTRTNQLGGTTFDSQFTNDLNAAIQIASRMRTWPDLIKELPITFVPSTTAPDGTPYPLDPSVDIIEQVRIIGPTTGQASILDYIAKKEIRKRSPVPTIDGTGIPMNWYYEEPTLTAAGVTKNMNVWPLPDQTYTGMYSFKQYAPSMVANTDVPFFNQNFHEILIDYAIWKFCEQDPDTTLNPSYFKFQWEQGLANLDGFYYTQVQDTPQVSVPDRYLTDGQYM